MATKKPIKKRNIKRPKVEVEAAPAKIDSLTPDESMKRTRNKITETDLALERAYQEEIEWRDTKVAEVFRETIRNKNKGGRPTKLTAQMTQNLEILASIGLSEKAMAQAVGIHPETLLIWLKKDTWFSVRVKKAREKGKAALVNCIFAHGRKNWQAHAWLLERMYRDEFALDSKQKVEVAGRNGEPITFEIVYEKKKEVAE